MELRIKCDAKVDLEGLINIVDIICEINDYKISDNSLEGTVNVKGNYIKDDLQTINKFNENVPFTVVFKNNIKKIEKIEIEDFIINEVFNTGIECKFNIHILYDDSDENLENDTQIKEIIISNEDDEKIKDDINKKYDELLEEILEKRDEVFINEEENEIEVDDNDLEDKEIIKEEIKENNFSIKTSISDKPSFTNIKDAYRTFHVYYPKKENELEEICNKENISIDKIYKDNANKDFKDKKRIIIK